MFWLLSLLFPGNRRESAGKFDEMAALVKSPQTRGMLLQLLGIVGAIALIWVVIAAILSLFNAWLIALLAIGLGIAVFVRQWKINRRENWIQTGHCAQCGYDLQATPDICPDCGRDARLDEPIWRRMRRELEAKLLADAEKADADKTDDANTITEIPSPPPTVRLFTKRPPADDTPIPLEGEETNPPTID